MTATGNKSAIATAKNAGLMTRWDSFPEQALRRLTLRSTRVRLH